MKENIILVGGGGHCKSCIDVIESENKYNIAGIIDIPEKVDNRVLNYSVISSDRDIPTLVSKYTNFLITIGSIKNLSLRFKLYNRIKNLGGQLPTIISPRSYISDYALVGDGSIIMHDVIINPGSVIGVNCIINSKALIEHDVIIDNNCHISTNATINGSVNIGKNNFVGSNTCIKQNIRICSETIIGMGSVIKQNIKIKGTYVGNPAKKII